jgi:outer membrane protein assembly factor BamD
LGRIPDRMEIMKNPSLIKRMPRFIFGLSCFILSLAHANDESTGVPFEVGADPAANAPTRGGAVVKDDWDLPGITLDPSTWGSAGALSKGAFEQLTEAQQAQYLLSKAKEQAEANKLRTARRTARRITRQYTFSEAAAEAWLLKGTMWMTQERWDRAFDAFQKIISQHPGFEAFDTVIRKQFDCATAMMEGNRGRFLLIFPRARQYDKARAAFETILRNAPYSDYASLALMNSAIIAQRQGKTDAEIDALDRLINFYADSILAPDAYFALAESFADLVQGSAYDQGSTREAISYFEDFLILFPNSPDVPAAEAGLSEMLEVLAESRLVIGDFYYFYRNNNTAALIFYNEAITVAPQSSTATEARQRIEDIQRGVQPVLGNRILRRLLFVN